MVVNDFDGDGMADMMIIANDLHKGMRGRVFVYRRLNAKFSPKKPNNGVGKP